MALFIRYGDDQSPNHSPEPTAVPSSRSFGAKADGAVRSAVPPSFHYGATNAVHAASRQWLRLRCATPRQVSFFR